MEMEAVFYTVYKYIHNLDTSFGHTCVPHHCETEGHHRYIQVRYVHDAVLKPVLGLVLVEQQQII